MIPFVLDCSVTIAWFLEDEITPFSDSVQYSFAQGAHAWVPAIWLYEVINAFIVAERRKRITPQKIEGFLEVLESLPVYVDALPNFTDLRRIMNLCREQNLASYDAAYLELAQRKGIPLATLDQRLITAAENLNIELLRE